MKNCLEDKISSLGLRNAKLKINYKDSGRKSLKFKKNSFFFTG